MGRVGEVLRHKRESRNLALEDVRSALGIPLHYLQAMENGGSKLVADEFYLIPYLRRYAAYLDLDPAAMVAQFLAETAREEARAVPRPSEAPGAGRGLWLVGGIVGVVVVAAALWLLLAT